MAEIVGVRFLPSDRVHYFDPGDHSLSVGDLVRIETDDGPKEGQVVIAPDQVLFSDLRGPLSPVLGKVEG